MCLLLRNNIQEEQWSDLMSRIHRNVFLHRGPAHRTRGAARERPGTLLTETVTARIRNGQLYHGLQANATVPTRALA